MTQEPAKVVKEMGKSKFKACGWWVESLQSSIQLLKWNLRQDCRCLWINCSRLDCQIVFHDGSVQSKLYYTDTESCFICCKTELFVWKVYGVCVGNFLKWAPQFSCRVL
jgi:hypothetical protein